MDMPLQGLLALGANMPHSPYTAAEPIGLPYKSPQDGEQPGEPGNIKFAQLKDKVAEAGPAPRAQPENLVLACFPTSFGCLTCNK